MFFKFFGKNYVPGIAKCSVGDRLATLWESYRQPTNYLRLIVDALFILLLSIIYEWEIHNIKKTSNTNVLNYLVRIYIYLPFNSYLHWQILVYMCNVCFYKRSVKYLNQNIIQYSNEKLPIKIFTNINLGIRVYFLQAYFINKTRIHSLLMLNSPWLKV